MADLKRGDGTGLALPGDGVTQNHSACPTAQE